jgi:hypothetical protein
MPWWWTKLRQGITMVLFAWCAADGDRRQAGGRYPCPPPGRPARRAWEMVEEAETRESYYLELIRRAAIRQEGFPLTVDEGWVIQKWANLCPSEVWNAEDIALRQRLAEWLKRHQ